MGNRSSHNQKHGNKKEEKPNRPIWLRFEPIFVAEVVVLLVSIASGESAWLTIRTGSMITKKIRAMKMMLMTEFITRYDQNFLAESLKKFLIMNLPVLLKL